MLAKHEMRVQFQLLALAFASEFDKFYSSLPSNLPSSWQNLPTPYKSVWSNGKDVCLPSRKYGFDSRYGLWTLS